jgi:hypothetical protein
LTQRGIRTGRVTASNKHNAVGAFIARQRKTVRVTSGQAKVANRSPMKAVKIHKRSR